MRLRVARKVFRWPYETRDTTIKRAHRRVMRARGLWQRHHPEAQYTAEAGVVGMTAFVEEWSDPCGCTYTRYGEAGYRVTARHPCPAHREEP